MYIKAINQSFQFDGGERIQTELSTKYNDKKIQSLINGTAFQLKDKLTDKNNYFADYIIEYSS